MGKVTISRAEYSSLKEKFSIAEKLITELQERLKAAEKIINSGLMLKGHKTPASVSICNHFNSLSMSDKDATLCVDITGALKNYQEVIK